MSDALAQPRRSSCRTLLKRWLSGFSTGDLTRDAAARARGHDEDRGGDHQAGVSGAHDPGGALLLEPGVLTAPQDRVAGGQRPAAQVRRARRDRRRPGTVGSVRPVAPPLGSAGPAVSSSAFLYVRPGVRAGLASGVVDHGDVEVLDEQDDVDLGVGSADVQGRSSRAWGLMWSAPGSRRSRSRVAPAPMLRGRPARR